MKTQELFERLKNSGKELTITMNVTGDVEQRLAELLDHIARVCNVGASRSWGIINGDTNELESKKIHFDGDGADHIRDIKINGKPVKEYLK